MAADDSVSTKHAPPPVAYLNEQLTISQLVQHLTTLHFDAHEEARVKIDPGVQAFLVRAARAFGGDPATKVRHAWRAIQPR